MPDTCHTIFPTRNYVTIGKNSEAIHKWRVSRWTIHSLLALLIPNSDRADLLVSATLSESPGCDSPIVRTWCKSVAWHQCKSTNCIFMSFESVFAFTPLPQFDCCIRRTFENKDINGKLTSMIDRTYQSNIFHHREPGLPTSEIYPDRACGLSNHKALPSL